MNSPPEDPVSPELALVDSGLRERLATVPGGSAEAAPQAAAEVKRARGSRRRRRSRVAVGLLLLLAVLVAGAATAVLIHRASTSSSSLASAAAPVARNFDWAPAAGATAYDVQILRDRSVVYSTRTTVPHVRVPAQWTRGAQTFSLTPGTYQWFVWPVRQSGRRGPAVVATTFEISRT